MKSELTLAEKIIISAIEQPPKSELDLNTLKRKFVEADKTALALPSKTELLSAYHKLVRNKSVSGSRSLEKLLTRRSVRTLSGVTVITSLVKPYACPGKCIYCPLDVRMPKSYISDEPAAARALNLKFDPYKQMVKRIEALENNGHPTDKIELIIKGGTWNAYPLSYQYWFILESFRAANGSRKTRLVETSPVEKLRVALFKEQKINERSKHRIIGLTLETRPDSISERTLWQMREQGCTRLEIGVQHTSDKVLKLINRGHTVEDVKRATELAKNFGYKTDFHLMPQLPGETASRDLKMLNSIFEDEGFRPDMIKIYPCTVVKGSELFDWLESGKYKTYSTDKLVDILKKFKATVPRYVRISRLIRDIPSHHIKGGNVVTNLRQVIQNEMKMEGLKCKCLRCREVGHAKIEGVENLKPVLFVDKYKTRGGTEYFLSYEDKKRQVVFAFCRLRILPPSAIGKNKTATPPNPLLGRGGHFPFPAYIRELHTYGQLVSIGKKDKRSTQHQGLGKELIKEAEKIVKKNKITELAVISGVGVRDYYQKLGYKLKNTYVAKNLH